MRWKDKERRKSRNGWVKTCSRCGAEAGLVRFREGRNVCVPCQNADRRRNLGERVKFRMPPGVGACGLVGDESPETDRAIAAIRRQTAAARPA